MCCTAHIESASGAALEKIPSSLYKEMERWLQDCCQFRNGAENGGKMRLAEYFVVLRHDLAQELFLLGRQLLAQMTEQSAFLPVPDGFLPPQANLSPLEQKGGAAFFHLDAAVTTEGLRLIECQAVPTYPVTAAHLSGLLREACLPESSIFLGTGTEQPERADFIRLMREILVGDSPDGNILIDRQVREQKTNFEFHATRQDINLGIEIIDAADLFACNGELLYKTATGRTKKVQQLYNRVLALEAIFDDNYPHNVEKWRFRYDQYYEGLRYCNHPARSLTCAKQQLVHVQHPLNPESVELAEAAEDFAKGRLAFADYVWKHKLGAAGRELILSPSQKILTALQADQLLDQYIAQRKVRFATFRTDDGQEKIIELRLMFSQSEQELIAVPMARIGHFRRTTGGQPEARIHFGDNNKPGYGFSPVLLLPPD
ncbi:hypothetical protein GCAAIG_02390 [Candidatus Electronema halotolerans]